MPLLHRSRSGSACLRPRRACAAQGFVRDPRTRYPSFCLVKTAWRARREDTDNTPIICPRVSPLCHRRCGCFESRLPYVSRSRGSMPCDVIREIVVLLSLLLSCRGSCLATHTQSQETNNSDHNRTESPCGDRAQTLRHLQQVSQRHHHDHSNFLVPLKVGIPL